MTHAGVVARARGALRLEEHDSLAALDALRDEWRALWRRVPNAVPFQSPDWLIPWWRHLGGGELWVMALRAADALVGVAPFFIWGTAGEPRRLSMVGAGISDYQDPLVAPRATAAAARLILERLTTERARWDAGELEEQRASSPLLAVDPPAALGASVSPMGPCPVVRLPRRWEELARGFPPRHKRNLRTMRNRLARAGDARFETATADRARALLDALFALHERRWRSQGEPGVLADARLRGFHEEVVDGFAATGALRLHALAIDGEIVAALYGFASPGGVCYHLSGIDPAADHVSPGVLLLRYAIEEAIREGARELDMLRGNEPYKYLWGAVDRFNHRLTLRPRADPRHRRTPGTS